jgi:hypothetical protein
MAITKITGASITADSIDGTKIADDAVNSEHLTDGGIDDVHIGVVAATKLTGTIADARLPATLPAKSGVNLTALNATNLGSGTVPTARLGSGTANNGVFLRGDNTWATAGSTSASDLTSGTLADARFPATLPAISGANLTGLVATLAGLTDTTVTAADPAINTNPSSGVGHFWVNTVTGDCFVCKVATSNNNEWQNVGAGSGDIVPGPYSASFLVIAGGGAGGRAGDRSSGGGGAGGYRSSFNSENSGGGASAQTALTLAVGTQYTVTIGAGAAGHTNGNVEESGAASSISGSDITDVTTTGGGGGAGEGSGTAANGGSGGGAGNQGGAGSRVVGEGYDGGASTNLNTSGGRGGGGGGASQVGQTGGGGAGLASTISGSSVTRAGGGGGDTNHGPAAGGTGGGGGGGTSGTTATSGTVNTGSGGGGHGWNQSSGGGGSGVVILRVATLRYSGTTTGSPTVSTSGSDTIITFNGSGSYTG